MSMQTSTLNGIGFPIEQLAQRKIRQFILKNKDELHPNRETADSLMELSQHDEDISMEYLNELFDFHLAEALAEIINSLESTTMFSGPGTDEGCGTKESMIYEAGYPFGMTARDKSLTYEDIIEILKKYGLLMGMSEADATEIDYLTLEYYG